jgi:hypothetical protein
MDNYGNGQDKAAAYQMQAMQDHMANAKVGGALIGQLANSRPAAIRERVAEACKRLIDLNGKLSFLIGEVAPATLQEGLTQGSACIDRASPTLTSDVDDLVREISRIEQLVTRLAVAITG